MDHSHVAVPTLENGNGSNGSYSLEQQAIADLRNSYAPGEAAVHELGNAFHDKLQVKDEKMEGVNDLPLDNTKSSILRHENSGGLYDSVETSIKCLHKCVTFPVTVSAENKSLTHLSSLPAARKLVSALKGSREKEGVPPKKLSVSWAPDVYDPPPTSVSHYPRKKIQQQYKGKRKHGKGKQKGKNVRGGGSSQKDKKQNRRNGEKSERYLNSYADNGKVMSSNNYRPALGFLDFEHHVDDDIGVPEPNCGSSFRGKACGETVHFAYAEAT